MPTWAYRGGKGWKGKTVCVMENEMIRSSLEGNGRRSAAEAKE